MSNITGKSFEQPQEQEQQQAQPQQPNQDEAINTSYYIEYPLVKVSIDQLRKSIKTTLKHFEKEFQQLSNIPNLTLQQFKILLLRINQLKIKYNNDLLEENEFIKQTEKRLEYLNYNESKVILIVLLINYQLLILTYYTYLLNIRKNHYNNNKLFFF